MNRKLLKNKNYTLLIVGNLVSLLGSNIQQFVLSLYVLAITGSATLFASMLAISILPRILLSPVAGVFGDWFDKKKSIVILDIINGLVLFGFAGIFFINQSLSIGLIYLLVVILEITEIFFHSSMSAVIPSIIDKDNLLEANSLRSMIISLGQLMAPILGALIYGTFGLFLAIIINATSFLLSAFSEMFIKIPKIKAKETKKNFAALKEDFTAGLKIIKDNKSIRTIIAIATIINFSIAPLFSVGLIFIIREVLMASDMQFGIFQSVLTASMIAAPILLTKKIKKERLGDVLIKSFILISLFIASISISTTAFMMSLSNNHLISYIFILSIAFFIGVLVTAVNIGVTTLLQKVVPLEFMGRTSTVLGLLVAIAIPIGQMLFGVLYDIINPGYVVIFNGLVILLGVLYHYKNLKRIEEEKPVEKITKKILRRQLANEV
jgi:MFS family permease